MHRTLDIDVGTVQIFWFSPGFGTEAMVGTGSGTSALAPTDSRYQGFGTKFSRGSFAFFSFW